MNIETTIKYGLNGLLFAYFFCSCPFSPLYYILESKKNNDKCFIVENKAYGRNEIRAIGKWPLARFQSYVVGIEEENIYVEEKSSRVKY